jgi:hypothetical protein
MLLTHDTRVPINALPESQTAGDCGPVPQGHKNMTAKTRTDTDVHVQPYIYTIRYTFQRDERCFAGRVLPCKLQC